MTTITIIGAGNMGSSLIGGLIANDYSPKNLWVTDPDTQKLDHLKNRFGINVSSINEPAIKVADVIILAVKPQIISNVANEIASWLSQKNPLIISIAAGTRIDTLQQIVGKQVPIVRCMPNTPALIACGASALFANDRVSSEQRSLAESILRAVGIVVWLDNENAMDTVTALSGCGPAYFFLIMEAMQQAAEKLGLPSDITRLLTLQTALGAAQMALASDDSVKELRRKVASPGGATERALQVFEEENIQQIFLKALTAAKKRSEELGG